MVTAWSNSGLILAAENGLVNTNPIAPRSAHSSYIPSHLRNRAQAPESQSDSDDSSIQVQSGFAPLQSGFVAPSSGWGSQNRSGGGRERETNLFDNEGSKLESLFEQENTGINFDAYEDIPIETNVKNVPPPVSTFA